MSGRDALLALASRCEAAEVAESVVLSFQSHTYSAGAQRVLSAIRALAQREGGA